MNYKTVTCGDRTMIDIECDGIEYKILKYNNYSIISITVCYPDRGNLCVSYSSVRSTYPDDNYRITVIYANEPEIIHKNSSVAHLFYMMSQPTISIEEMFEMIKTIVEHSLAVREAKIEYDAIINRNVGKNYSKK